MMAFDVKAFLADEVQAEPPPPESAGFDINAFLAEEDNAQNNNINEKVYYDIPTVRNDDYADVPVIENRGSQAGNESTLSDKAAGVIDVAKTLASSATTGMLGYFYGTAKGLLHRALGQATPEQVQQMAEEYQQLLTIMPDTEEGRQYMAAIGEALPDWLPPVAVAGIQMPLRAAAQGVLQAAPPVRNIPQITQQQIIPAARQSMNNVAEGAVNTVRNLTPGVGPKPDQSIGAAQVGLARLRQEQASELPIDPKLTKGQATQDVVQQKFERELAKTPLGKKLRKHFNEQNPIMRGNLDAFIDDTGTKLGDFAPSETGGVISQALDNQVIIERKKINQAYDIADNTPEAKEMVNTDPLADFLNENSAAAHQGTIYQTAQKELMRENYANGNLDNNNLDIDDMPVWRLEKFRQYINSKYDRQDPRDRTAAFQIKDAIDQSMGDAGGEPYARARRLRNEYGKIFENRKLVNDLISKKPNSDDRKIALENFADKAVNKASNEDLVHLRKTLYRTNEGKEAYNELGAQILKDIKENSGIPGSRDPSGNHVISSPKLMKEINRLDRSGKLELLYGKKTAEQLRTLSEVAKDVYLSQEGAVNRSNTATTGLMLMMDVISFQQLGSPLLIPLKLGIDQITHIKIKKKIKEALNYDARK